MYMYWPICQSQIGRPICKMGQPIWKSFLKFLLWMLNTYSAISHLTPIQTNGFYWSISYWMVIFDFNYDIKLALTVTIFDEIYSQTWPWSRFRIAFTTSLYLLCYVMKLDGMICKLDRFLENLQIVQCNLQIGWPIYQLADWPGQFANWPDWQIGRNITPTPQLVLHARLHCTITMSRSYTYIGWLHASIRDLIHGSILPSFVWLLSKHPPLIWSGWLLSKHPPLIWSGCSAWRGYVPNFTVNALVVMFAICCGCHSL